MTATRKACWLIKKAAEKTDEGIHSRDIQKIFLVSSRPSLARQHPDSNLIIRGMIRFSADSW